MRASANFAAMRMRSVVQPLIVCISLQRGDRSTEHELRYVLRSFAARIKGMRFCVWAIASIHDRTFDFRNLSTRAKTSFARGLALVRWYENADRKSTRLNSSHVASS